MIFIGRAARVSHCENKSIFNLALALALFENKTYFANRTKSIFMLIFVL